MTAEDAVVRLGEDQVAAAAEVFRRAFWDDPLMAYMVQDQDRRHDAYLAMGRFGATFGRFFGEIYTTLGEVRGIAIWLTPRSGAITDERLEQAGFGELQTAFGPAAMERFGEVLGTFEEIRLREMPAPHWYLLGLGVDPPHQRQGIGSRLIAAGTRQADAEGAGCYLETQRATNVDLYRKHGFDVVVDGRFDENTPYWTMKRLPR